MTKIRLFVLALVMAGFNAPAPAQEAPKPPAELENLKKLVGTWDTTMKMMGTDYKGTAVYKMDLGGMWVASTFECKVFGGFSGRGFDTYDAGKKKYIGVWIDSMNTMPLNMEGDYDKATKTMTMIGTGYQDGKPVKHKIVTQMPDDDTMNFSMYGEDAKEPVFTILYKRKK